MGGDFRFFILVGMAHTTLNGRPRPRRPRRRCRPTLMLPGSARDGARDGAQRASTRIAAHATLALMGACKVGALMSLVISKTGSLCMSCNGCHVSCSVSVGCIADACACTRL